MCSLILSIPEGHWNLILPSTVPDSSHFLILFLCVWGLGLEAHIPWDIPMGILWGFIGFLQRLLYFLPPKAHQTHTISNLPEEHPVARSFKQIPFPSNQCQTLRPVISSAVGRMARWGALVQIFISSLHWGYRALGSHFYMGCLF